MQHVLPGRVRLRAPILYLRRDLARELERRTRGSSGGVVSVLASARTASVVVAYREDDVTPEVILSAIADIVVQLSSTPDELHGSGDGFRPSDDDDVAWHRLSVEETAERLGADPGGLDDGGVLARFETWGRNALVVREPRSALSIVGSQLSSVPVVLLTGSAVLSLATGGVADAVAILLVVVANAAIGYVTESRAERTILELEKPSARTARVRRNGVERDIDADGLVPGDAVVLGPATLVPADLRIVSCSGLQIDESTLTGESAPVSKRVGAISAPTGDDDYLPLGDRVNMAFRGTLVTSGSGVGMVVATGPSTEIGRIQSMAGELARPVTPMQRQLAELGTQLAIASGLVCGGVFVVGWLRGQSIARMLQTALSLAVAAVPEGLPTVATTTLALGIGRMRRAGVLVRRLDAIETLGAVQIVCFDKTGTVTENRMSVVEVSCGPRRLELDDGIFRARSRELGVALAGGDEQLDLLLRVLLLCSSIESEAGGTSTASLSGSPTEVALAELAIAAGLDLDRVRAQYPLERVRERAEARTWMDTLHRDGAGVLLAVKGRPSDVLGLCRHVHDGAAIRVLDEAERSFIRATNDRMAGDALRVLGVAYARADDAVERRDLVWLGLVAMTDPPRRGVSGAIDRLHAAGVATAMLTGDQSATALAIGRHIGLVHRDPSGDLEALDAAALERLPPDELRSVATRIQVFSRVSPAHKLAIVQALQRAGFVVAMTGDGVNDSPALKAADVGIAMGSSGAPVAREVAAIVLRDDDLATILGAIEEGRTIHDDIKKAVHFILATNLGEILLTAVQVGFGLGDTLSPMQLLWINLLTDVLPELALAAQPPESSVLARPPRRKDQPMFERRELAAIAVEGATITAGAIGAFAWSRRATRPERAGTVAFTALTCAQLLHAFSARSVEHTIYDDASDAAEESPYVFWSVVLTASMQVVSSLLPTTRRILGTLPLSVREWAAVGGGAVAPLLLNEGIKWRRFHARRAKAVPAEAASARRASSPLRSMARRLRAPSAPSDRSRLSRWADALRAGPSAHSGRCR